MIFSQGLEWPSITFEWLPSLEEEGDEEKTYKALIGSNANEREQSYLQVVNVKMG